MQCYFLELRKLSLLLNSLCILQDGNIVIKVKFVTILHVSCEKSINIICIVVVWCVITELKFVSACGHNILKLPEHGSENQLDKHIATYID